MESLRVIGYRGQVYPVNPKYEHLLGSKCYASIRDLPEAPDVVAFCVSHSRVLENIKLSAERGARGAIIYDGGFAEYGDEGNRLQADIVNICQTAGIELCGPNCMGVLNPHDLSSLYIHELRDATNLAGNVGLISQSGSICIALLADIRRFGFSHVISSGNEAALATADYMEALIDEPRTKVIGLFTETVRQPERFVAALDRAASVGKPVVVLKVGRTERTQLAITTHTGGLAGSSKAFSEVLRSHRAIEANDLDEFTEILAACQAERWPTGCRTSVITASGGVAELILDVASGVGVTLPPLPMEQQLEVKRVIGPIVGDGNPLDAWGNGDYAKNLPNALQVLDANEVCDNIVLCLDGCDGQPMGRQEQALDYMKLVVEAAKTSKKPHFVMGTRPGVFMKTQVDYLRKNGMMYIGGARQGLGALDRLAWWSSYEAIPRKEVRLQGEGITGALRKVPGRATINEFDAKKLLDAEGLPVTLEKIVTDFAAACKAAAEIGYPIVLKAVSDDIAHKSDLGLVLVNVGSEEELEKAWALLDKRVKAAAPYGRVTGILVQEMVTAGIEVFAGINRDPNFGLVFAFGLGGVAIEVLQDVALRVLPLREGDAKQMISEIRGAPLLRGARGVPPCDVDSLIDCLETFADYAWADRDAIAGIDLNPIKVLPVGKGCLVVDALIIPQK
jgi:acyl-CoA synthetase (NDP forming)